jgi:hypothetical protein
LGKIAILPFTGGSADEQEGIAELLSGTREMMGSFGVLPRTGITRAAQQEQAFQAASGMTDADTIAKLGNQFGAEYVVAGSITSLNNKHLLIVSITKIDVIRQVAGDFLVYDTLDALNKDETLVNTIAANLVKMVRNTSDGLDKLALLPVDFPDGGNRQEGDALAQLLAIYLLRGNAYAVYPRTKTLEQVQREYETQLTGGVTRVNEAVRAGAAVNPPYVLSVASRKIGSGARFNAAIIEVENNVQIKMKSEQYANLSDGMIAMDFLARGLNGETISKKERDERMRMVNKETVSTEKAEADRIKAIERAGKRAAAKDKFLKNSGIAFGGWLGPSFGGEKTGINRSTGEEKSEPNVAFSGGGDIGLRIGWFDIQTGLNGFGYDAPYTPSGKSEQYEKLSIVQIPILARFTYKKNPDNAGFYMAGVIGVGMNFVTKISDAESSDPAVMSFIAGAEVGAAWRVFAMYMGYQWDGDIGSGSLTVDGEKYDYKRGSHRLTVGMRFFVPFRRN